MRMKECYHQKSLTQTSVTISSCLFHLRSNIFGIHLFPITQYSINLMVLNLSNNQLSQISDLENLYNLKSLLLSNNLIEEIDGLENLIGLELLDLSYNRVREIQNLDNCQSLNSLSISNNLIEHLGDLAHNLTLEVLDLRNNRIKVLEDIDLKLPNSLKTLYLQNNEIEDIFQPRYINFLENIQNVNITNNPLIQKL